MKNFKLVSTALWLLAMIFSIVASVLYAQEGNLGQSILMGVTAFIQFLAAAWVWVNIKC
jgi:hypothetical protein